MYFAFLILFFAQFSFAADKPGSQCKKTISKAVQAWEKLGANVLGRRDKCAEIDPSEVQQLACKKEVRVNARDLKNLGSFVTGEWADEGVFQIVAGRSEKKILCRNSAFDNYLKVPNKAQELNQKAITKFEQVKADLSILVKYREELSSELVRIRALTSDPRISQATKGSVTNQQKKIAEVQQAIAMAITELPMGAEPEVTKAYEQMATGGSFNQNVFRNAIAAAQQKYIDAKKYYFDHSQPLGEGKMLFCLDEKYRSFAVKSGASSAVLDELLPKNSKFRSKLDCRFNATYGVGAKRVKIVEAGAMLASMAFWSVEMAAVKGFQWARAATTARGAKSASQALNTVVAVSQIQMACLNEVSTRTIASEAVDQPCDPEKEFKRVINESDNSYCGVALAWNSTYLAPHVLQQLSKARALKTESARAVATDARTTAVADAADVNPQGFIVTRRPVPALYQKTQERAGKLNALTLQGHKFKNQNEHLSRGENLELLGDVNGSEFSRLVYKVEKNFGTKVYVSDDMNALGEAKDNLIVINRNYLLQYPDLAKGTLLHEIKHTSSNRLKTNQHLDRLIEFRSADNSIPTSGYSAFMRADEVEARLTQIAKLKAAGRIADARRIEFNLREMARVQRNILDRIKPANIDRSTILYKGTNSGRVQITVPLNGKPIDLSFVVARDNRDGRQQIADQIKNRATYLTNLIEKLDK